MKVCVLGSGSGGNCTYVAAGGTRLLIDLGFGPRRLARLLREAGLEARLDAILLSHGHQDHTSGVAAWISSHPTPVYANQGTIEEDARLRRLEGYRPFETGSPFQVGDIWVEPFPVPHDCADPVGFRLSCGSVRGALVTDLGYLSDEVLRALAGCDWLVLESNHDEELLKLGPYPWELKRRVLGRLGHLSNQAVSRFLAHDLDGRTSHIFLAHLSRQNNAPGLALESARRALGKRLASLAGGRGLHLTSQDRPSVVVDVPGRVDLTRPLSPS